MSSLVTRPLAIVASTGTAYSIPGKWKSEAYCAVPLTFNGPSTRGVLRPLGDGVVVSCVVGMFSFASGSLSREFQRVCETAFGQLHLESVLALRFGATQRRIRRFLENGFRRRLTCQFAFRLSRPPRLCTNATHRDASSRYFRVCNRDHHGGGSERKFVGSAVAQFQIKRSASRRWRRKRDVSNQVAW